VEKPHRSGWRPILESEFDLAYSPLMELDYGRGRVALCTLDLEDHAQSDPAAERLTRQLVECVRTAPLAPRAVATYLGDDTGAALLDRLGVVFRRASVVPADGGLLVLGDSPAVDPAGVKAFLEKGGKAFCLPTRHATNTWLAVGMKQAKEFHGSLRPPAWPETAGLSASDLRWRTEGNAWVLDSGAKHHGESVAVERDPPVSGKNGRLANGGARSTVPLRGSPAASPPQPNGGIEIGADGLLGRKVVGKGVALIVQTDPDLLDADKQTYLRFTRWRQTRALSQLLANMGATLAADHLFFAALRAKEGTKPPAGMYHPDYLDDFARGDDPYRYYRW
jgi:beta-galactosidase